MLGPYAGEYMSIIIIKEDVSILLKRLEEWLYLTNVSYRLQE